MLGDLKHDLLRVKHTIRRLLGRNRNRVNPPELDGRPWAGLRGFIGVLNGSLNEFELLVSAIDKLLSCIAMLEDQTKARGKYNRLKHELEDISGVLSEYFGRDAPAPTVQSITSLVWGIENATESLLQNQQEDNSSQGMTVRNDAVGILKCYRRVLTLLGRFALNESTKLWKLSSEQEVVCDR
ncbi:hypothetical protein FRC08_014304 [Ceratobasidium sp. 394]|nr:hypothetical protein FRC08_014304 [Ceratobasidium sp. 394]